MTSTALAPARQSSSPSLSQSKASSLDMQKAQGQLSEVLEFIEKLDKMLQEIESILKLPFDLQKAMKRIQLIIEALDKALLALTAVPVVNAVAGPVRESLQTIRVPFNRVLDQLNNICRQIKPYFDWIKKVRQFLNKIKGPLQMLNTFMQMEQRKQDQATSSIGDRKESRYKGATSSQAENLAGGLMDLMRIPLHMLSEILKALNLIMKPLNIVMDLCLALGDIIKPVLALAKPLNAISGALDSIDRALRRRITILFITMSVKDILMAADTVLKPLTMAAEAILKPLLNTLKNLPIPGIKFILAIPEMGMGVVGGLGDAKGIMGPMQKIINSLLGSNNMMQTFKSSDDGLKPSPAS